jgi:methionine-rich copper-binding protein CopC
MFGPAFGSGRAAATLLRSVLLAGGMCAVADPARAHAHLQGSTPAANASLTEAPRTLELTFTEPLEPRFSGVTVQDQQGRVIPLPAAQPNAGSPKELRWALPALPAGVYAVSWRATCIDTHRSEGRFVFTIRQP